VLTVNHERFKSDHNGTFGLISGNGLTLLYTVEPPIDDPEHPCIPPSLYHFERTHSTKRCLRRWKGLTFVAVGVPYHTGILVHPGNTILDTKGCILPGIDLGTFGDLPGVRNSQDAYGKFLAWVNQESELLWNITESFEQ